LVSRHYPDAHGAAIACPGLGRRRPPRDTSADPTSRSSPPSATSRAWPKALPTGRHARTPVI